MKVIVIAAFLCLHLVAIAKADIYSGSAGTLNANIVAGMFKDDVVNPAISFGAGVEYSYNPILVFFNPIDFVLDDRSQKDLILVPAPSGTLVCINSRNGKVENSKRCTSKSNTEYAGSLDINAYLNRPSGLPLIPFAGGGMRVGKYIDPYISFGTAFGKLSDSHFFFKTNIGGEFFQIYAGYSF